MTTAVMTPGLAQADKFHGEAVAALCMSGSVGFSGTAPDGTWQNPGTKQVERFQRPSIQPKPTAVAAAVLVQNGVDPMVAVNAAPVTLAMAVTGDRNALAQLGMSYPSMATIGNVTGMYQALLIDAGNVQLRKAYTEVETTFQIWATRGEDFENFDKAHSVSVGSFPDPTAIGEDGEFDEVGTVDGREELTIHAWGQKTSWSFKLIANDRLGAIIGSLAGKMGAAMKRKQNRLVYSVLKDNRALSDGGALFNGTAVTSAGGHANLTTGSIAADGYSAALNTVSQKLGAQRPPGADSSPLGITPAYVLHPPALNQTFFELLESPTKPGQSNPGVPNMHSAMAKRVLEWELAAQFGGSDTAWYVVGDPMHCEGVVYAYLKGQDGPQFDVYSVPGQLGYHAKIHQAFAAGAVDFRPLQKHAGA